MARIAMPFHLISTPKSWQIASTMLRNAVLLIARFVDDAFISRRTWRAEVVFQPHRGFARASLVVVVVVVATSSLGGAATATFTFRRIFLIFFAFFSFSFNFNFFSALACFPLNFGRAMILFWVVLVEELWCCVPFVS